MPDVHPVADLFPMLADDELKELADDIAERGLLQPIVLDIGGRVLDGRNRLAACEMAGIEPEFTTYDGDDADGYALAVNIARRHLTKGQIAMVAARAVLVSKTELSRDDRKGIAAEHGVGTDRVHRAKTVLDHAPDLADSVVSGARSLDDAYNTARERKKAADSERSRMEFLRAEAPDVADLVAEERLTLEQALAELPDRQTVREIDEIRDADGAPAPSFAERVADGALSWSEAAQLAREWKQQRGEAIQRTQERIRRIVSSWGAIWEITNDPSSPYVADILDGLNDGDRKKVQEIVNSLKGGGQP